MDTLRRAKLIEAKADEALRKTDQTKPPIDLVKIATHYGVPVRRGARDDRVVSHYDNTRNEIVLGEHDRWPFAHELGHALLAHGSVRCYEGIVAVDADTPQSELSDDPEAEANRFARHVLVPRQMAEFLLSRGLKIPDLAKRCEVSETVVWYALVFYGLV